MHRKVWSWLLIIWATDRSRESLGQVTDRVRLSAGGLGATFNLKGTETRNTEAQVYFIR